MSESLVPDPYRGSPSNVAAALIPTHRARLSRELQPGEQLLWTGQPPKSVVSRPLMVVIPFVLVPVALVAVLALASASTPYLIVLPLLAIGLLRLMLLLRRAWQEAQGTFYALTDRRALLFGGGSVRAFSRPALAALHRTTRDDGSGDLIFNGVPSGAFEPVGFIRIPDVDQVEALIRQRVLRGG